MRAPLWSMAHCDVAAENHSQYPEIKEIEKKFNKLGWNFVINPYAAGGRFCPHKMMQKN